MMEIKDITKSDVFDYEAKAEIWGEQVGIGIDCDGSSLDAMLPLIEKLAEFLDKNKDKVVKALVEDDFLSLAEDWASSAEEAEESTEENECYIMEDGTKVYLPITEDDFAASLHFDGISVYFDDDKNNITSSVYLVCQPDYFAYHCIEIFVDGDGAITVNGLAG